jgi:UDP-glucose:(heptosyl)LPS alpha-1,3-glucosyltransferase
MHIAIIKSNFTPYGGAEKYTTRLIHAFVERDAEVDILTSAGTGWEGLDHEVKRVILKQYPHNNLLRLLSFNSSAKRYLRKAEYDCILGMDRTDYQTHLRAGSGCHAAWIQRRCNESSPLRCLSFKTNPFHRTMIKLERRAFLSDNLKRIFCNSHLVKNEILHFYPETEKKLMVVHNGVEWHEFSRAFEERLAKRKQILENLCLQPDRFYFLFLGSGYERKGLMKALMALRMLPEYVELLVAGKDRQEENYKSFCEKSGIAGRVRFFGPQKDVIPFLQISDAFVLPTIYDPFSNASLEALAMGLYTVTSEANGCSEVIRDGAGSIIGSPGDISSVAEAMKTALDDHLSKEEIRETVRHLDFETQLGKIVTVCLEDTER